jgi:hypothetical protein
LLPRNIFNKIKYILFVQDFFVNYWLMLCEKSATDATGPTLISLFHTFVNIPALISKRSMFLSSRAGIFTKVWKGDIITRLPERNKLAFIIVQFCSYFSYLRKAKFVKFVDSRDIFSFKTPKLGDSWNPGPGLNLPFFFVHASFLFTNCFCGPFQP